MKIDRSKNAKRNIVAGLLNKLLAIILPFVVRTIFISALGAEYLGLNSLFTSILQVLNLSELGIGTAIIYSMYKPIAENNRELICKLLNFYRKTYKVIGIIILGVGLCIIPFLPRLIKGTYPSDINIYYVYIIYLINTVLSYLLFAYKSSLFTAHQRNDITSNINTIILIITNAVQCAVLLLISSERLYYYYIIIMPITTILNNLLVSWNAKRAYPEYVCKGDIPKDVLASIKKQVGGLMVTKICQMSRNSLDSIFVSAFIGLTMTTIYANYYYIMNAVSVLIAVVTTSIVAGVGNSIVVESVEKNYSDLRNINFIYMWISGWCTICLFCLYQPFMNMWMGEKLMLPLSAVSLFAMYFYALRMGDIRGLYSDAAGLWWENRWRAIAESIANVVLNVILGKLMGIQGIILGTLISLLIINFGFGSQIIFRYYFIGMSIKQYFLDHLLYLAVTFLACVITYYCSSLVNAVGFVKLLLIGFICIMVPNIIYVLIYFRTNRFKTATRWLVARIKHI